MLPSDRLSHWQRKKMNGEITVYKMKVPITLAEFKSYPLEYKKEYLQWFVDEFGMSQSMVGKLLGTSQSHAGVILKNYGLMDMLRGHSVTFEQRRAFDEWLVEQRGDNKEEVVEEKPKAAPETPVFFNTITGCEMSFEGSAAEISQTIFSLFRNQRIAVNIVFAGAEKNDE